MSSRLESRSRDPDADVRRLATYCGVAAPAVALGAVALATVVASPETFTWRGRALSDMGRYGTRTFVLFNGGLILGGLLGLPFAWRLWITARDPFERVGIAALVVATLGLIGVGVFFIEHTAFYLERDLHGPAAMTYFVLAPFAQWLYGTGAVRAGRIREGLASFWLGIAHPLVWLGWLLFLLARTPGPDSMAWFAVPEFVAALAVGCWFVVLAADLRRSDPR